MGAKNAVYKYGSCKIAMRFARLTETSSCWYPTHTSVDSVPYAARYKPIKVKQFPNTVLIPNANIYNFEQLKNKYQFTMETSRKEEIIIHLYHKLGMVEATRELQGEFSFILCDDKHSYLARDITGTRGLYFLESPSKADPIAASLRASLLTLSEHKECRVRQVPTGAILYTDAKGTWRRKFYQGVMEMPVCELYTAPPCRAGISLLGQMRTRLRNIIRYVTLARTKGCPVGRVGLLLSGGLNSRVLGNVLHEDKTKGLKSFFIGTKTSHERNAAENAARNIGAVHHDILLDPETAFEHVPKIIELIETYDTASVRKAILLYMVCRYIHEKSAVDVLVCGEGLDDITGSHIYYKQAVNADQYQEQIEGHLNKPIGREVYDKIASWFGITIVFPYLDPIFASFYLSFPATERIPRFGIEKYFFRSCLDHSELISEEVLWRHHEEWVDSVSSYNKFWLNKVQKLASSKVEKDQFEKRLETYLHNPPTTHEELYYRQQYELLYPNQLSLVPIIQRPPFEVGSDPSPRRWAIYPQHLCIDFLHTVRVMV